MTAIPNKSILDGSATPTTAQFKSAMGQLHDYLNERSEAFLTWVAGSDTITANTLTSVTAYTVGQELSFVAVGDNGAVVTGFLSVTGNGTFGNKTTFITGLQPVSIASGDLNNDGKIDLITSNFSPSANSASVLLGNGNGTFLNHTTFGTGSIARELTLGDINNDNFLDIITVSKNSNIAIVL